MAPTVSAVRFRQRQRTVTQLFDFSEIYAFALLHLNCFKVIFERRILLIGLFPWEMEYSLSKGDNVIDHILKSL